MKSFAEEGEDLDKKYHRLICFGIFDPVEARSERLVTGMSAEEQQAQLKGVII